MARLADRLLAEDRVQAVVRAAIKRSVVIAADNVAEYYWSGTDQEMWYLDTDFPNVAPPFKSFWIEARSPTIVVSRKFGTYRWDDDPGRGELARWGILFEAFDLQDEDDSRVSRKLQEEAGRAFPISEVRWLLVGTLFYEGFRRGVVSHPIWTWLIGIRPDGLIWRDPDKVSDEGHHSVPILNYSRAVEALQEHVGEGADKAAVAETVRVLSEGTVQSLHIALLTLSFMHCKNVEVKEQKPNPKMSRAFRRRHGSELISYRTVEIDPMKRVLHSEGGMGSGGSYRQAIHICRGHFKHFGESWGSKKLFGKHEGMFWWGQMIRGRSKDRVVLKDYDIKGPGGE